MHFYSKLKHTANFDRITTSCNAYYKHQGHGNFQALKLNKNGHGIALNVTTLKLMQKQQSFILMQMKNNTEHLQPTEVNRHETVIYYWYAKYTTSLFS